MQPADENKEVDVIKEVVDGGNGADGETQEVEETSDASPDTMYTLTTIDTVPKANSRYLKFLSDNGVVRKIIQLSVSAKGESLVEFYCRKQDPLIELCDDWLVISCADIKKKQMSEEDFAKLVTSVNSVKNTVVRQVNGETGKSTISTSQSAVSKRQQQQVPVSSLTPPAVEGEQRIAIVTHEDGKYVARYNGVVIAKIAKPEDFWSLLVINRWTQKAKTAACTDIDFQCNVEEYVKTKPVQTASAGKKGRPSNSSIGNGPNPVTRMAGAIESTISILSGASEDQNQAALMAIIKSSIAVLKIATSSVADVQQPAVSAHTEVHPDANVANDAATPEPSNDAANDDALLSAAAPV